MRLSLNLTRCKLAKVMFSALQISVEAGRSGGGGAKAKQKGIITHACRVTIPVDDIIHFNWKMVPRIGIDALQPLLLLYGWLKPSHD